MLGVIWFVEMHNVFDISLVVRREALTTTLSMKATSGNVEIVQFYSYTRDEVWHTGDRNISRPYQGDCDRRLVMA